MCKKPSFPGSFLSWGRRCLQNSTVQEPLPRKQKTKQTHKRQKEQNTKKNAEMKKSVPGSTDHNIATIPKGTFGVHL